jgi:hypothetical protein
MATDPDGSSPDILSVLPVELLDMPRWLLWKESPHPKKPNKTRKTPFYVNGLIRRGLLDTEADLAQLTTLDEAWDAFLLGDYAGIGFALSGDGVGAFDLDWILDDDKKLLKTHAGYELAVKAKKLGCYIEVSPSGHGLRIVGPCSSTTAYSKDGLEYWGAKRFVTLTGDLWANPQGWKDLDDLREPFGQARDEVERKPDDEEEIITPETIETLVDALEAIDSEERDLWVRIGIALKTLPNNQGFKLFMDWSKKAPNFDRSDAIQKWETFNPTHTSYKVVFKEAQENWEWVNPKKGKGKRDAADAFGDLEDEDDDDPSQPKGIRAQRIELDLGNLYPTEFIIDGFLPTGVSVIAGAWGAGKSTNLIPLLASAAHLAPEAWGFWPTIRRRVIWVTEAPEQARDTLYSLAKAEGAAQPQDFADWFHLFRAVRTTPKKLAREVRSLIEENTYQLENGFRVNPVVVLDTTAANIEIENESDNSMVSQAMAILKQALPGVSLVLVGHTPKALVKADVNDMTFRGAGAWEADAVATYFLIYDADTDTRYLAIRKCRFTPNFREVDFDHEGGSRIVDTPWGEAQSKAYLHGVPTKSDGSQRRQQQENRREEQREVVRERTLSDRQQRIMGHVSAEVEAGRTPTRGSIRAAVGGKAEMVAEAIQRLIEADLLGSYPWDVSILGPTRSRDERPLILPTSIELDLFLQRVADRTSR